MLSTQENFRLCSFATSEMEQKSKSRIARNATKRTEDLNSRRIAEITDKLNAERQNEKNTNKKGNKQTWKQ